MNVALLIIDVVAVYLGVTIALQGIIWAVYKYTYINFDYEMLSALALFWPIVAVLGPVFFAFVYATRAILYIVKKVCR